MAGQDGLNQFEFSQWVLGEYLPDVVRRFTQVVVDENVKQTKVFEERLNTMNAELTAKIKELKDQFVADTAVLTKGLAEVKDLMKKFTDANADLQAKIDAAVKVAEDKKDVEFTAAVDDVKVAHAPVTDLAAQIDAAIPDAPAPEPEPEPNPVPTPEPEPGPVTP